MRTFRLELPQDLPLLSLNDSISYRLRAERVAAIRYEAYREAMRQDCEPFTGEVRIRVIYNASDNRRRDTVSGNYAPSWKAAIDGLVDAGIIPDDSDSIVSELSVVRGDDMSEGSQLIVQVIGEDST